MAIFHSFLLVHQRVPILSLSGRVPSFGQVLGLESNLVFHGSLVSACEKERRGGVAKRLWPAMRVGGGGVGKRKHMEQVPFGNST